MASTNSFCNTQSLQLLIEQALPALYGQAPINIWYAGCTHGPGPHALAILLREQLPDNVFRNLHILATDVDSQLGPVIASGIHSEQEVKRLPYPIRYRYFQMTDEPGYSQVIEEIRTKVSFARHNLLSLTPVCDDFNLIVCKDILPDLDEIQRRLVFRMFHSALHPGGLLATEHTQKIIEGLNNLFEPVARCSQIYRRVDAPETKHSHINGFHVPADNLRKDILRTHSFY
jgi:chemotaxis protein methyltransferase CheR